jgi:hypothetical protein
MSFFGGADDYDPPAPVSRGMSMQQQLSSSHEEEEPSDVPLLPSASDHPYVQINDERIRQEIGNGVRAVGKGASHAGKAVGNAAVHGVVSTGKAARSGFQRARGFASLAASKYKDVVCTPMMKKAVNDMVKDVHDSISYEDFAKWERMWLAKHHDSCTEREMAMFDDIVDKAKTKNEQVITRGFLLEYRQSLSQNGFKGTVDAYKTRNASHYLNMHMSADGEEQA